MIDWIQTNIPPWVPIAFVVHFAILGTVAYLILLERKIASWTQDRIGPNRVGPYGLFQPLADGLKFILKEDYRPRNVDKVLFTIAPALMITVVIISIAVLPWGGTKQSVRRVTFATQTNDAEQKAAAQAKLFSGARVTDVREVDHVDPFEGMMQLFEFIQGHFADHPELIALLSGENLLGGRFLRGSSKAPLITSPLLPLIERLLRRGERQGLLRGGLDPLHLYVVMVSLCYFHRSNAHTLSTIFATDLLAPSWQAQHKKMATDVLSRFLRPR